MVTARGFDDRAEASPPVPDDISVWQVALPGDRRAADRTLAAAQQRLTAAEAAVPLAAERLAAFANAGGPPPDLDTRLAGPEYTLYDWTAAGAQGRSLPAEAGRLDQVVAFFAKVQDALRNYAVIDTDVEDTRIGRTRVSWSGDFRTVWLRGLALDDAQQHTAAVALTLRTRDTWVRLGMTVAAGAVQLTTLFSLNPALALPATYRFVLRIIQQVQVLNAPGQEL